MFHTPPGVENDFRFPQVALFLLVAKLPLHFVEKLSFKLHSPHSMPADSNQVDADKESLGKATLKNHGRTD